jgi:hypothetical protein
MTPGAFTRAAAGSLALTLAGGLFLAAAPHTDSLEGWWLSDGYGTLLEIRGDRIKASQVTAVSCLPDWTAKRQAGHIDGAEAVFVRDGEPVKFLVTPGRSADHKFFGYPWAASRIGFHRVKQPPAVCGKPTANSPRSNFDIFWTTFHEHYPFFAMHGVDWKAVGDKYRGTITDKTSPDELFGVFRSMVGPLHDAHVFLRGASDKQGFQALREGTTRIDVDAERKIKELIEDHYVHGKLKTWCRGRVGYATLPGSVGYLRINAFAGYAEKPDFDAHSRALEEALDEALSGAASLRGLVVDVRVNRGGSDVLGVAVASRLAPHEYLAFAKRARNDPAAPDRFTDPQKTLVRVSDRPHFHGKVVLLTGPFTISAGETFTMALMGRKPAVTRVGENTQGVFSDVLGRKLPNGFRFGLPNEIFLTEDGKTFDGPGIPPHVRVAVFPKEDLAKGHDGCLARALEILGKP